MKNEELRIILLEDAKADEILIIRQLQKKWQNLYLKVIEKKESLRELLNQERWDLVITDYKMPQMTGLDTIKIVKEHNEHLPVIMVSGTMGEDIAVQVIKAGADDYLLKDKLHRLIPVIERVMEDYKRRFSLLATREALKQSHFLSEAVINDSPLGIVVRDSEMRILHYNKAWQRIWNFSDEEVEDQKLKIRQSLEDFYDYAPEYQTKIRAVFEEGKELIIPEIKLPKKRSGRAEWISQHFYALKAEGGKVGTSVAVTEDISEKKIREQQTSLKNLILEKLNSSSDWHHLFRDILTSIKTMYDYDSLGLRLQKKEDFPYFVQSGFCEEFIKVENSLINSFPDNPRKLDCLCGSVICQNHDNIIPGYNLYGSFWINNLSDLLAYDSDDVKTLVNRGTCLRYGYKSIALIPLMADDSVVGLLQVNNFSPDRFNDYDILFLEEICRILGIAIQRMNALNQLKQSESKFMTAFNISPSAIGLSDIDSSEYLEVNKTFLDLFDFSIEEVIGKKPSDLFDFISPSRQELLKKLPANSIDNVEWQLKTKKGKEFIMLTSARIIAINDKKINFTSAIDITDRKNAEQNLRCALEELEDMHANLRKKVDKTVQELRSRDLLVIRQARQTGQAAMLSQIAHHWRQPLNAIGVIIQSLADAYEFDELTMDLFNNKVDESMDILRDLSHSIDNFREIYGGTEEAKNFQIFKLLSEIADLMSSRFYTHDIEFVCNLQANALVHGVSSDYAQALINILDNAYEVIVNREIKNPQVVFNSWCFQDQLIVTIKDNGGGINPEVKDHIFELYSSSKDSLNNTGIGLYMSKFIIEQQMGGSIKVIELEDGVEFQIINQIII